VEPWRRIEPKYAAGRRSFTGLLVRRDATSVVLRDAQNKEIVLAAKDVERLQPSRVSLMPDGQLAGLTAQEAADLLAYLAGRKGSEIVHRARPGPHRPALHTCHATFCNVTASFASNPATSSSTPTGFSLNSTATNTHAAR